jgi:ADP-ribose pyrophosphatase YjhB (NUDIX family)
MPGIVVNVAVIQDGKILLTKREDFETWVLPSGGVEAGESVAQAAIRETKEETGLDVELIRLVGVYSRLGNFFGSYILLFVAKPVGGEIKCQEGETIAVEWFAFDSIPSPLSIGHKKRIEDALSGVSGVTVLQEITRTANSSENITRKDLLDLRDQSGLSRQEFWLQLVDQMTLREQNEFENWGAKAEKSQKWLDWAREIQALAQTGLTYSRIDYDIQRYHRLEGIAAEIIASHTTLPQETILENFRVQPGYATPKIDVRGAIIRDGKILLVQERSDGGWTMPGGWGDVGEAPSAMVAREVWEESGYDVRVEKLVAVYDANRLPGVRMEFYHAYKLIFLCTITGGGARPSSETSAVDFFDLQHLPPLSNYRTDRHMLEEVFAHFADPARPAAFD